MDKRITFDALRAEHLDFMVKGTVTGRLCSSGPEIQELPKIMDTRRLNPDREVKASVIRTSGPCPDWVRSRWPESPVDLGAQIHQQIDRMVRHQDHELAKAVLFGNWDAMEEYCKMDVEATQEALNATNKIMAAMEDTLELDLFDLPEEPEYDGDDLMAAVRSFCRQ